MTPGKGKTLLYLLGAVCLLIASSLRIEPINDKRFQFDLEPENPFIESQMTSELRLPLPALSIFRSLAINYLWIRAEELKNAGQYFDALHIARMICALQPNLAAVWDFQGWNMAYNISVGVPTPPERWHWVRAGFELLRDEGLVANPHNAGLYLSLSRIFQHKIGDVADEYHRYYKLRLAYEMMPLVGESDQEDISGLAEITTDWNALNEDPDVKRLAKQLMDAEPRFSTETKLIEGLMYVKMNSSEYSDELLAIIADNVQTKAFRKLDLFIRAKALREQWKLDPARMIEMNNKYGPIDYNNPDEHLSLDWRHPKSHAIYWASRGLEIPEMDQFTRSSLQQIVYHSLQSLFNYGRIQLRVFEPPPIATQRLPGAEILDASQPPRIEIFLSQDLRMFYVVYEATIDILNDLKERDGNTIGVENGLVNLARAAIVRMYLAGQKKVALKILQDMKTRFPDKNIFKVSSLDRFVAEKMREDVREISSRNARGFIDSILRRGYKEFALQEDENAAVQEKWAQQIYAVSKREFPDEHTRLNLPPFTQMRWSALLNFLDDAMVNPDIKSLLLQRMEIENPEVFDQLKTEMDKRRKNSRGQKVGS